MIAEHEMVYLKRCLALAEEALEAGDSPFGSVLVDGEGQVLREDRNRIRTREATWHPELALARWAAEHMSAEARQRATVYTSGEHCPMCAAAHAWAGIGRVVYIASGGQLTGWLREHGLPMPPVALKPIQEIAPEVEVVGPVPELVGAIEALHVRDFESRRVSE